MTRLIPLVTLCLLLCGCGQQTLPDVPDSILPPAVKEIRPPEEPGGDVQKKPLNLTSVQGLRTFEENLLLFCGTETTTLTLLDSATLEICASSQLSFFLDSQDPSLQTHPDGSLSFYHPLEEATVVLNASLEEVQCIPMPGAAIGAPILSEDGSTLFYCTASHLRAWNRETSIRRCIKELLPENTTLVDVLMNGTVLQCQTGDETIFLSADDGHVLYRNNGTISIDSDGPQYYASFQAGLRELFVFGQGEISGQMLIPEELSGNAMFLPECSALLTTASPSGSVQELTLYDLTTGYRIASMALASHQQLLDGVCVRNTIYLLIQQGNSFVLYLWTPQRSSEDNVSRVFPCVSGEDLSSCRTAADALEARYGIQLLLGQEAADAAPWNYNVTPEHFPPLIQQELALLEKALSSLSAEILQQTASHFQEVRLCLVRDFASMDSPIDDAGALVLDGNTATILLPLGASSGAELYRQLFHLMEIHIFGKSNVFDNWNDLNPAGFQYDYDYTSNALRDSGVYLFGDLRAFVDTFSMSYPREDRASIFALAMEPGQEMLFQSTGMQKKLQAVCTGIRDAYSLQSSYPWEQYLE